MIQEIDVMQKLQELEQARTKRAEAVLEVCRIKSELSAVLTEAAQDEESLNKVQAMIGGRMCW